MAITPNSISIEYIRASWEYHTMNGATDPAAAAMVPVRRS